MYAIKHNSHYGAGRGYLYHPVILSLPTVSPSVARNLLLALGKLREGSASFVFGKR